MWFEMRRETVDFVERAPTLRTTAATVAAPREHVFHALVDAPGWPRWFPNVRTAAYTTPAPYGPGTIRLADVAGTRWKEEIIAWDDDRRWGWTVVAASVPLASAQVELFELTDTPTGTAIRWTLAIEPRLLARLGAPFVDRTIGRLWQRATRNLERVLHRQRGAPEPT